VALAFLCGLMYLMTALIKDGSEAEAEEQMSEGPNRLRVTRQRAAAIAVALARAEQDLSASSPPRTPERVSAWRALHHQRQLMLRLRKRGVR
jgi:hypothetical protein